MPGISIVDPNLKNRTTISELSIQVSPNGFSFCVLSAVQHLRAFRHYELKDVVLLDDLLSQTEEILEKDDILQIPAKKVRIITTGRNSTILPIDFTQPESLKKILNFNHPVDEMDEIHINKIGNDLSLVFTVHHYLSFMFSKYFEDAEYYSQATPMVNHAMNKKLKQTEILIQVNKDFFDMVILVDGEFRLYNNFLYVNSTDMIYFILYACKQLNIDAKKTPFHFMGDFSGQNNLFTELLSYLPRSTKIHPIHITSETKYSHKVDASRFYSLLSVHQCEL